MSDEFKLQVSVKFGDYDQHMLNVRADNGTELEAQLDGVPVQKVVDFGSTVKAAQTAQPLTQAGPAPTAPPPPAAPVGSAPSVPQADAPHCPHGRRNKRSGVSSKGAWTGFMCPLPKGHPDQCDPVWDK